MPSCRKTLHTLKWGLVGLLLAGSAFAARPAEHPAARLRDALAADDLVAAREALGAWIEQSPDYPALHYNLACVEAKLHEPERAVAALSRAFRLGFDDVRRAAADPDLVALSDDPAFRSLLDETLSGLERGARRSAVALIEGESLPLVLRDADGRPVPSLEAALTANTAGFAVDVTAPAGVLQDGPAPWRDGGGLVLTLAAPGPDDVFDTTNAWRFGFGVREGLPVGVVLAQPDRILEQQILELAPELTWNMAAGERHLSVQVPWAYLAPYAPPADSLFGVNLAWTAVPDGDLPSAMVVPDPADPAGGPGPRRYLPLLFRPNPDGPTLFGGRVPNTVVGRAPLPVELVAWSPRSDTGILSVTVEDNEGRSVVTTGGDDMAVELAPGLNTWVRRADLSALPEGPFRLRARLVLADSTAAEWRTGLFRFGGDWAYRVQMRAKGMPDGLRASLDWRLGLVEASLSTRDPRSSPAPLITTVAETEGMVRTYDTRGTILPDAGDLILACPDDRGLRPVRLVLPQGWSPDAPPPVLVLADREAATLTEVLAEIMTQTGETAILARPNGPGSLATLRSWLGDLFPGTTVNVVGGETPDVLLTREETADNETRRVTARRLLEAVSPPR